MRPRRGRIGQRSFPAGRLSAHVTAEGPQRTMTVGLVLGAGGPLGWAYHLGVLEGVRAALGHEPAGAQRIIGTSAGGAIAASLLAGASSDQVLDAVTTPPSEEDLARMREAAASLRKPWRRFRPLSPGLLLRLGRSGGLTSLIGLLPAGVFPTSGLRRFPIHGLDGWPDPLWMPSVRIDDGRLVVFGRDRDDVDIADAIEATAAVPGMFQPKVIDGARYIDGAVASATHADLLVDEGHEVVLVSSPMTRPGRGLVRARAQRQLDREVAQLHGAGTRTVVLCPDEQVMRVAEGFPRTNPGAGHDIVEAARDQAIAAFT